MIVRNEEQNLPECLRGVADLVDEIVVVDTGSTDRTRTVAEQFGARVYDFPWCDDFAAARNETLRHATGDWVLSLDADDRLDEANRERLRALFASLPDENVCYEMHCLCLFEPSGQIGMVLDQTRLFRRHPRIRWRYRIHENITLAVQELGGEVRGTDIVIRHVGYTHPARYQEKLTRNLRLLRRQLEETPEDAVMLFNLGLTLLEMGQPTEAIVALRRSIERADPRFSILGKMYTSLINACVAAGRGDEALAWCEAGRRAVPEEGAIWYGEGMLRAERGQVEAAVPLLHRAVELLLADPHHGYDPLLRHYRALHQLAALHFHQGRLMDAERAWRRLLDWPVPEATRWSDWPAAWLGLGEVWLRLGRVADLEQAARRLAADPAQAVPARLIGALWHRARRDLPAARQVLEPLVDDDPGAFWPRVALSGILLDEATDLPAAERVLGEIVSLNPNYGPARVKLALLAQQDNRIALSMIVRNEETNLPACLAPVADLVDEMIVVDTGSTDRTKEVAAQWGARVFEYPWNDDFAAARNEALRRTSCGWVFWLDADDRIDAINRARLQRLFSVVRALPPRPGQPSPAFMMTCLCWQADGNAPCRVVEHPRLFRNHPSLQWVGRVHEQILPALQRLGCVAETTDIVIEHRGYADAAQFRRKQERNLRLLQLQDAEQPNDPYTHFNLGVAYYNLQQHERALEYLERSRSRSEPSQPYSRKLYELLAPLYCRLGRTAEAWAACRAGRRYFPDNPVLAAQEAELRQKEGDLVGAETCLRTALQLVAQAVFPQVDSGQLRHNLASLCLRQGRWAEAEAEWRRLVAENPDADLAWLELADLWARQQRWGEMQQALSQLQADPRGLAAAVVVQARWLRARGEHGAARQLLERVIERDPRALGPRVALSHVLLEEGRDWSAAAAALEAILSLNPGYDQARQNLAALRQRFGPALEGTPASPLPSRIVVSW
ncbi:MAG: glycosyltransferase [Gemmataceae bacterium]|nr:glycosyltransferase [Gemmataceae bacterium]MDW8265811.1 glycosyltransferase [Gemmataceae bacterium]